MARGTTLGARHLETSCSRRRRLPPRCQIYGEVVTALPLNGGAYNALLNTTSKSVASVAACLAILSYIATGVVSATEACEYLNVRHGKRNHRNFLVRDRPPRSLAPARRSPHGQRSPSSGAPWRCSSSSPCCASWG